MFNRKRQMEGLSNVLVSSPKFSVITQPVHSGKTTLMDRVIKDLPKRTQQLTRVKSHNLREESFHSVESFVDCLQGIRNWVAYNENMVTNDTDTSGTQ